MLWKLFGPQFTVKDRRLSSLLLLWPKTYCWVLFRRVKLSTSRCSHKFGHIWLSSYVGVSHFILTFLWKTMYIFVLQHISKKILQQNIDGEILHTSVRKLKPRIPSKHPFVQLCCCFVLQGWFRVAVGISSLSSLTYMHVILMKYFGGNLAFTFQICFVAPVGRLKLPSQQLPEYHVTQHALMPCHISVFAHSMNSPKHCVDFLRRSRVSEIERVFFPSLSPSPPSSHAFPLSLSQI